MKKTILIVEDEKTQARSLQLLLENESYKTIIANNADECLDKLKTTKPDLILLDVMMPGKIGTELLKDLTENPEFNSIPVIIVTIVSPLSGIENDIKKINPKAGFIEKPYTKQQLMNKIKEYIK